MSNRPTVERAPSPDPGRVADMLDSLAAADQEVAEELDRLACSASPISSGTIAALERLLLTLRPATAIRTVLAGVDRSILVAAIGLRRARRDTIGVPGPRV